MYRWRIPQVGRRHGKMAVKFGVIMVVICIIKKKFNHHLSLKLWHGRWNTLNTRKKRILFFTTKSAKTAKKLIIIKYLCRHLRLSGRVPLAYSVSGTQTRGEGS